MYYYFNFIKEILKGQLLKLTVLLILQVFAGISPVLTAWLNGKLIDQIFVDTTNIQSYKAIIILVILSSLLIGASDLFLVLQNLCSEYFKDLVYKRVQFKLLNTISLEPTNNLFEDPQANNLISIVKQNVHDISEYVSVLSQVITMVFGLISALILGFAITWWIPMTLLFTMVPFIYYRTKIENKIWNAKKSHGHIFNKLNLYERILTLPDFAKDIRLYEMQNSLLSRWLNLYDEFFNYINTLRVSGSWMLSLWAFISGIGPLATFWYVAINAVEGHISLGRVSFLLGIIIQLRGSITCLLYNSTDIFRVLLMTRPLLSLIYRTPTASVITPNTSLQKTEADDGYSSNISPDIKSGRALLRFENVSFSYPGSQESSIKNLSFELIEGQTIAIVGENGSGKSTLLKLICRLYGPAAGKIYWQGHDISMIDFDEYRAKLSVLFQDFAKFPISIRENVDPKCSAEEDAINKVLRDVKLDFLQGKLDVSLSKTDDNSLDISGGQWQRLALARLLLHMEDSTLLLFDEPTSSLDANTEYEILNLLSQIIRSKSSIIVSHRLALCKFAHQIIVMDKGNIVEQGNHDQLMAIGKYYKQMFRRQASWYTNNDNI